MQIGDRVKANSSLFGTIIGPCTIGRKECWRVKFDNAGEWDEPELNLVQVCHEKDLPDVDAESRRIWANKFKEALNKKSEERLNHIVQMNDVSNVKVIPTSEACRRLHQLTKKLEGVFEAQNDESIRNHQPWLWIERLMEIEKLMKEWGYDIH